jgi:hypothetical protein
LGIADHDLRDAGALLGIDNRTSSPSLLGRRDELVAVEVRAAQSDEQLTSRDRAGIRGQTGKWAVDSMEPTAAGTREIP